MPFREPIRKATDFLLRHVNDDGGLCATQPDAPSGYWTTAEAIEAFLKSVHYPKGRLDRVESMLGFILEGMCEGGGWPLLVGGQRASTMATGHVLAALAIAERELRPDSRLREHVIRYKELAAIWLIEKQNRDHGWSIEPDAETDKASRMISTTYALRGLVEAGYTARDSKTVSQAADYIQSAANHDHGWGSQVGNASDPCNTARAVTCLIRCSRSRPSDRIVRQALGFIVKSRARWKFGQAETETYVAQGSSGETVFNMNTPYDLLEAFMYAGYRGHEVRELVSWFLRSQEDDGRWFLEPASRQTKPISTWPTSEAIIALELVQAQYVRPVFDNAARQSDRYRYWRAATGFLMSC